jgi:hypothetical protein
MMRFGERVGGRPERSTPRIVGRQRVSAISRVADQVERGQGFVCKRSACVTQSSLHRLVSLAMPESDERGLVRNFLAAGEVEAAGVKGLNQPTSTDQHHDSAICDNSSALLSRDAAVSRGRAHHFATRLNVGRRAAHHKRGALQKAHRRMLRSTRPITGMLLTTSANLRTR